jgi:hypothetical protein
MDDPPPRRIPATVFGTGVPLFLDEPKANENASNLAPAANFRSR